MRIITAVLGLALVAFAPLPGVSAAAADRAATTAEMHFVNIRMSDGVDVGVAVYLPKGQGPFPALLAASPYRLDNDQAPSVPIFPFRETGPIAWYVDRGYAFVRMDVRGTGRSGGEYRYQDAREQRDLYEAVEWIAAQPWSSGRVGGIGQSYYARSQWFMAAQAPPHLACIAPYDGNIDTYRASAYTGGIPGIYPNYWYNYVRTLNGTPFAGDPRQLPWDYPLEIMRHPTYDGFWRERSVAERLDQVKIPVFSIGVWGKVDLHLNGNIVGYQRVAGPKKLLVLGGSGIDAAVAEFSSPAFHERYLLPFYDWCLKGQNTSYLSEPDVRYTLTGTDKVLTAATWPPRNVSFTPLYLSVAPSGSVSSLNDGSLAAAPAGPDGGKTTLNYPHSGWSQSGVVSMGADGRPDTARRVLSFTTAPLDQNMTVAGPLLLRLAITSSRSDADFVVKVYEQMAQPDDERQRGSQPRSRLVTKGWLRASHRAVDASASRDFAPWYKHDAPEALKPNEVYELEIAIMPTATEFRRGNRIRLEIANSDSMLIEAIFAHAYGPNQVGSYTILHNVEKQSSLWLPVLAAGD